MACYDNGGSPSSPVLPADAALPPAIPRTASELEAAEEARQEAVAAQAEIPEAPRAPLTGKGLLALSLATVFGYLCLGILMYTTLAGMSFLDALYFCVGRAGASFFFLSFRILIFRGFRTECVGVFFIVFYYVCFCLSCFLRSQVFRPSKWPSSSRHHGRTIAFASQAAGAPPSPPTVFPILLFVCSIRVSLTLL